MVKIKGEPVVDELEIRYRGDSPENNSNVQYYQVGGIGDQVRAAWGEDEVEVKPKIEQIEFDPNRQLVIKLNRDFLRKIYRNKWIDYVLSTYRHRRFMKACQLCFPKKLIFDSSTKLIEHYEEFHQKESKWYKCIAPACHFAKRQKESVLHHWERLHKHQRQRVFFPPKKYTVSRRANDPQNIWIGDDELVHSMFFKKPFECDICLETFNELIELKNHKIMNHSKENEIRWHKCDQCDKMFRLKQLLKIHVARAHNEKVSCCFCSKKYSTKLQLAKHERLHRNEALKCEFCDLKFINKIGQYMHIRKHHFGLLRKQRLNDWFEGVRTFECYRCRFTGNHTVLQKHITKCNFEGNNIIECKDENCIQRFDTMKEMENHYNRTHEYALDLSNVRYRQKTYECYICRYTEKGFRSKLLKKHLAEEHPKENKCNICNATFRLWKFLKEHEQRHGERRFKCEYCPKLFRQATVLRAHEKTHTKPIKCERCDFRGASKDALRRHIKNRCGRPKKNIELRQKRKYTTPRLVRSEVFKGPFKCEICLKTFKILKYFNNHKIMHHSNVSEIELHKCDQCNKEFRLEQSLKSHKKTHNKKFACAFCSKLFSDKGQLRRHELKHRNEMLTCEFCDVKFTWKWSQLFHYRKLHFGLLRKQDKLTGGLNKWFQGDRTFECYICKYTESLFKLKIHIAKSCTSRG